MKIDPYKNKEKFNNWKKKGALIPGVSKVNERLIVKFLLDLEEGSNVDTSNKRGSRSYIRLNAYRSKLKMLAQKTEERFDKNFPALTKEDFNKLIKAFNDGEIKRKDGKAYMDIQDYLKTFKAFWHHLQRTHKTKLKDITIEAEAEKRKAKWVYLDSDEFSKIIDTCKPYYKTLAWFALDTGIRATELKNVRVSDISPDMKELEIREETAKTFGRKIKIMMCSELLAQHIEANELKDDDIIFEKGLDKTNEYFKRRAKSIFGDKTSKGKELYKNISVVDFRHISACYWLPRYPTQQGMMYRFGWKKSDKVFYYSEFLGMVDNISEGDLLIDTTKTELQQDNQKLKSQMELLMESSKGDKDQIKFLNEKIDTINNWSKSFQEDMQKRNDKILKDFMEALEKESK